MQVIMFWQTSEDTSRLVKAGTESDGERFFFFAFAFGNELSWRPGRRTQKTGGKK